MEINFTNNTLSIDIKKSKEKKRRWDVIIVTIGMIIGFIIIMMKLTGNWPCDIAQIMDIKSISCDRTMLDNINSIYENIIAKI